MPAYRLILAYDGTEYHGWQVQPDADTIQGRVEAAVSRMAKTPVGVTAAGRTDAGVHAHGQCAHFRLAKAIPPPGIRAGLNTLLPGDIRVLAVDDAPDDFHARFDASAKTYRYRLETCAVPSPFRSRYALHCPEALDRGALDEAAGRFEGEHEFDSFRAAACSAKTTRRLVSRSRWLKEDEELVYEITASGFLHHMIRNIVGTLLEVGRGRRAPESMSALLAARDRTLAGPTAPAKGLHLVRVDYR